MWELPLHVALLMDSGAHVSFRSAESEAALTTVVLEVDSGAIWVDSDYLQHRVPAPLSYLVEELASLG